jgi:hypothetical protein
VQVKRSILEAVAQAQNTQRLAWEKYLKLRLMAKARSAIILILITQRRFMPEIYSYGHRQSAGA